MTSICLCVWVCDIKVALKPYFTLGHIFAKPKDPVKTNQKTQYAVYSIPVGHCEKEYLGQSKPGVEKIFYFLGPQ
jgi:hypothetical protein